MPIFLPVQPGVARRPNFRPVMFPNLRPVMVPMAVSFQSPRAFHLRGPYCAHQAIFQTAAMTPGTELHDIRMEMGLSPHELWEVMSAEIWRSHAEGLPSYWDRIYDGIVDMSNGRPCSLIPETRTMFRDRRRHGRARPNHHRIEDERIQRRPRVEGPHGCDVCIDNRQHHPSGHHQGRNRLLRHVEPFDADHSMGTHQHHNDSRHQSPRHASPIPPHRRSSVPVPRARQDAWSGDEGRRRRQRYARLEDEGFW